MTPIKRFVSYDRIVEKPESWKLSLEDSRLFDKVSWVVTEKVHGANFCLVGDGNVLLAAKRKAYLQKEEDFFSYRSVLQKFEKQNLSQTIFSLLCKSYPTLKRFFLYGELFGGEYPHKDVPKNPLFQAVQTGVYYSPSIEFYAFDIAIETKDEAHIYLDYQDSTSIFQTIGLFYAEPLFIGSFSKALEFPVGFLTKIPKKLTLPEIENNKAEGIVIKPVKTIYIQTKKGKIRPILKKKITEFAEEKKFYRAEKWTRDFSVSPQKILQQMIPSLVTENRLHNAISKVGKITSKKQYSQLFSLYVEDVTLQLQEDYEDLFEKISKEDILTIKEMITLKTRELFQTFFSNS